MKSVFAFSFVFIPIVFLPGSPTFESYQSAPPKLLVFSKTAGFRHDSIPDGITAIRQLGQQNAFEVDVTEDATDFNDSNLSRYQTVVFLSTTGDVLNTEQQGAFERFVRNGGGFVGIHSATDTEYDWRWYGGLIGAYFQSHPAIQQALVKIEDNTHPSTTGLPATWVRNDEWYNFRLTPRGKLKVLATLDETTYSGGTMGADHPIAWCQIYDGGRSWYTAGGHTRESYNEQLFRQHLLGGIQFTAKIKDGACSALSLASAASFKPNFLAAESITSLFGVSLSDMTQPATTTPLPTSLAGVSVRVKDSAGVERPAPLFYVSPTQINFLLPHGASAGQGLITVVKSDGTAPSGDIQVSPIAPALFTANSSGQGAAAGVALRVKSNFRAYESITQFDSAQNQFITKPIDLGQSGEEIYLALFGTGIRFLSSQSAATIKIGGINLPVLYAGMQGEYAGLDQINVRLPNELAGSGEVDVELAIDGQTANTVRIAIR